MQYGRPRSSQRVHEVQRTRQRSQTPGCSCRPARACRPCRGRSRAPGESTRPDQARRVPSADRRTREPQTRLGDREVVDGRPRAQFTQQREDRRERGVEVPRRRAGRDHGVDLLGGHVRPQQQLLVADAGEPAAQLGRRRRRRLVRQLRAPAAGRGSGPARRARSAPVGRPKPPMAYRITWSEHVRVALADDVEQRLRDDHLRERRDHDRVAQLGADLPDLLDEALEAVLHADLAQLPPGRRHARRRRSGGAGTRRRSPAGCPTGSSLGDGQPVEEVARPGPAPGRRRRPCGPSRAGWPPSAAPRAATSRCPAPAADLHDLHAEVGRERVGQRRQPDRGVRVQLQRGRRRAPP